MQTHTNSKIFFIKLFPSHAVTQTSKETQIEKIQFKFQLVFVCLWVCWLGVFVSFFECVCVGGGLSVCFGFVFFQQVGFFHKFSDYCMQTQNHWQGCMAKGERGEEFNVTCQSQNICMFRFTLQVDCIGQMLCKTQKCTNS